jgi:hypothetical protein
MHFILPFILLFDFALQNQTHLVLSKKAFCFYIKRKIKKQKASSLLLI